MVPRMGHGLIVFKPHSSYTTLVWIDPVNKRLRAPATKLQTLLTPPKNSTGKHVTSNSKGLNRTSAKAQTGHRDMTCTSSVVDKDEHLAIAKLGK